MSALVYPGGQYRPLGEQTQPRITPEVICVHTIVGNMRATYDGWKDDGYGGLEATFAVGGKWGEDGDHRLDGVVWQAQDVLHQADANYHGSHRVVSIETGDNATPSTLAADIERWTPKQAAALVDLIAWLCEQLDIPAVLVPDSRPGHRGLAYHRQGVKPAPSHEGEDGWLVPGGERWSKYRGKECPGPRRIKQFVDEIIPAVQAKLEGADDMAFPTTHEDALSWFNLYWRGRMPGADRVLGQATPDTPARHLVGAHAEAKAARARLSAVETRLSAIESALAQIVAALPSSSGADAVRAAVAEEFATGAERLRAEIEQLNVAGGPDGLDP